MADSGIITMTGGDEYLIGGFQTVLGIVFYVDTPTPEVDYLSVVVPRRILHAGWLGLASGDGTSAGSTLTFDVFQVAWWSYYDHEGNVRTFPAGVPNIDRLIWQVPPGITNKAIVYW